MFGAAAATGLGIAGSIIGGAKAAKAAKRANKSAQTVQDTMMQKAATMGPGDLSRDATGRSWMKQFDRQAAGYMDADPRQRYERGQAVAARQLMQQARGLLGGPSAAELQMAQGMQDAQRGVASGLASQRGLTPAMAAKLGAEQRAGIMSDAAAQGAILRAQEDAQRQQAAAAMRAQAAGIRSQMDASRRAQEGMDRQTAMGLMGMGMQRTAAEEQALRNAQMTQLGVIQGQNAVDQLLTGAQMQNAQQWSNIGGGLTGLGLNAMAPMLGGNQLSGAMGSGATQNLTPYTTSNAGGTAMAVAPTGHTGVGGSTAAAMEPMGAF